MAMRLGDINGILRPLGAGGQRTARGYSADKQPVKGKLWGPRGRFGLAGRANAVGRGATSVVATAPGRSAATRGHQDRTRAASGRPRSSSGVCEEPHPGSQGRQARRSQRRVSTERPLSIRRRRRGGASGSERRGRQWRLQVLICTGRPHLGESFRQLPHRIRRIVARTGEPSGSISSSAPKRSCSSRSSRTPMRERRSAGHLMDERGASLGRNRNHSML